MRAAWAMLLLLVAPVCQAQALQLHGWLDLRAVAAGDTPGWVDGGLGKLRWDGSGDGLAFGGAALQAHWTPASALLLSASAQLQDTDRGSADLIEAWARWRPVSTTPWRHSLRAGLFFPQVSLENDALAWTSPYTLTPSAINSWIGEELRSLGLEYRVEHRGRHGSLEAALALFGGNDPAGELLAVRGWSLSDLVYGLGSSIRTPDISAREAPPPRRFDPFVEVDDRAGWHGELTWRDRERARLSIMRYDNRADPTTTTQFEGHEIVSWRTRFWSAGGLLRSGQLVWIAQAMLGDTEIRPSPFFRTETAFWSGFLLAARDTGLWRPALRLDLFGTREHPSDGEGVGEHGRALTAALSWRPQLRLRLTAELIHLRGARSDRVLAGLPERFSDTQLQLSLRTYF